jgi:hypothetical protein
MSSIEYKFNNEADFAFYILNAAAHDFIHDFNNYGRMGKILNYIMNLVNPFIKENELAEQMLSDVQNLSEGEEFILNESNISLTPAKPEYDSARENDVINLEGPPVINSVSGDIANIQTTEDMENPTANVATTELYISQEEEHFISTPIEKVNIDESSSNLQTIVNNNITVYNSIAVDISPDGPKTRGKTKRLNILQRIKDFIDEAKFLIISKLRSARIFTGGKVSRKQRGGGIDIVTRDDIIASIKDIIEEINESKEKDDKLIHFFEYIMYSYIFLHIPNVSPLDIFNNSIIQDNVSIFIIGQCNNIDIKGQAKMSLTTLLSESTVLPKKGVSDYYKYNIAKGVPSRSFMTKPSRLGRSPISVGGAFNKKVYDENIGGLLADFEEKISSIETTPLYNVYSCKNGISDYGYDEIYNNYRTFIEMLRPAAELIAGKQMVNVKTKMIESLYVMYKKGGRTSAKNAQEMLDTINDLIFIKTIDVYKDIKNRASATRNEDSGDGSSIRGDAKAAVQQVSKLIAFKILELTGLNNSFNPTNKSTSDLKAQINILDNIVRNDKGYMSVDDVLIRYFTNTYESIPNNMVGDTSIIQLNRQINACAKSSCRVINNAAPNEIKSMIGKIVVCPTSSVCDGMGSFGSCINPVNKEYANMNFSISYAGGERTGFSYYGQTNIKPNLSSVNINYGIVYKNLQIYNFIDINIDSQPIVLQANFVFKNLINRIIEIWKINSSVTDINQLWSGLQNTDYFLSILKLGSQKAVGDIFQEINSTLANGGYNVEVQGLSSKQTYGLMGDRPSGVRVIKLLNDAAQGKNPNASGGYVGGDTSLIYFSPTSQSIKKKGGMKTSKNRRHKLKTNHRGRQIIRNTKRRRHSKK